MNCLKCLKKADPQDKFCKDCNRQMLLDLHLKACELAFTWHQEADLQGHKSAADSFKRILDQALADYNRVKESIYE